MFFARSKKDIRRLRLQIDPYGPTKTISFAGVNNDIPSQNHPPNRVSPAQFPQEYRCSIPPRKAMARFFWLMETNPRELILVFIIINNIANAYPSWGIATESLSLGLLPSEVVWGIDFAVTSGLGCLGPSFISQVNGCCSEDLQWRALLLEVLQVAMFDVDPATKIWIPSETQVSCNSTCMDQ